MNREINYIILYIIMKSLSIITPIITLLFTCCPKNTLICKLDLVYRYIVYNEKPVYSHFTHIFTHSVVT